MVLKSSANVSDAANAAETARETVACFWPIIAPRNTRFDSVRFVINRVFERIAPSVAGPGLRKRRQTDLMTLISYFIVSPPIEAQKISNPGPDLECVLFAAVSLIEVGLPQKHLEVTVLIVDPRVATRCIHSVSDNILNVLR
jgi:hypothetical protein